MEELIAKVLPEELKERRRLYEEEMEELSKYAHCCFQFHSRQLIELKVHISSPFNTISFNTMLIA